MGKERAGNPECPSAVQTATEPAQAVGNKRAKTREEEDLLHPNKSTTSQPPRAKHHEKSQRWALYPDHLLELYSKVFQCTWYRGILGTTCLDYALGEISHTHTQ